MTKLNEDNALAEIGKISRDRQEVINMIPAKLLFYPESNSQLIKLMQETRDTVKNNAANQINDAELLRSKPGGFKQLGSMGKSYKIGKWIDPRPFFKRDSAERYARCDKCGRKSYDGDVINYCKCE